MAQLMGWSLPMSLTGGGTDHAYVTSDEGHRWGCFGRDRLETDASGVPIEGHRLCIGTGSAAEASCISGGNAGILYAVNGLCWQAANRILYPTGTIVSGAHGYCEVPFGRYGEISVAGPIATIVAVAEWSRRRSSCSGGGGSSPPPPEPRLCPPDKACSPDRFGLFDTRSHGNWADDLAMAYFRAAESSRSRESLDDPYFVCAWGFLELAAGYEVGHQDGPSVQQQLKAAYARALRNWERISADLQAKTINPQQFADYFHSEMVALVKGFAALIGDEATTTIFGITPGQEPGMIDAATLAVAQS